MYVCYVAHKVAKFHCGASWTANLRTRALFLCDVTATLGTGTDHLTVIMTLYCYSPLL